MDMAFFRRAERMLAPHAPARLDHALLLASLAARRAPPPCQPANECVEDPLIEILLGGSAWRNASSAQCGCFNRAEAGRRINAP